MGNIIKLSAWVVSAADLIVFNKCLSSAFNT